MKLDKTFDVENYSRYYDSNKNLHHSIKFVVDDVTLDISKFVLGTWSMEFQDRADEDSDIFLTEFIGNKDQVRLCIELLHGKEVAVDVTNISVVLKFATIFKVPEMIDATMVWFQQNISVIIFANIVSIYADIDKQGHKSDHLLEIIRSFIVKNTNDCIEMMSHNFEEDIKLLIDVLIYDGPLVNQCLILFNDQIREDKEFEYLMEKLEIVSVENDNILAENINELDKLMDKVADEVENRQLLKVFSKFSRRIPADNAASCSGISPSGKGIIPFQCWRTFSKDEILKLKINYGLSEFQYAAICLDWIEIKKPSGGDVLAVYNTVQQEKLEYWFVCLIRYILHDTLNYRNIPALQRLPVYEFDYQEWDITKQELLDCLNNTQTVQLTHHCTIRSCTQEQTHHTINIRLESTTETITVQLVAGVGPNQHEHDPNVYVFWYLWYCKGGKLRIATFDTKSYREIIELVNQIDVFYIYCLIRKV